MQVKTILNRVYRLPGFVYGKIRLLEPKGKDGRHSLEVEVRPRANGQALCSGCGQRAPGYDQWHSDISLEGSLKWGVF